MGNRSSIAKINEQIDMLKNEEFVDKPKTIIKDNKIQNKTVKNPDNSASSNEKTKIFTNKNKIIETITIGKVTIDQKKVENIYLPIFLILLIFLFLTLIVVI